MHLPQGQENRTLLLGGNQRSLKASFLFATRETQNGFRKRRVTLAAGRTAANHFSLGSVLAPLKADKDEHWHNHTDYPNHRPSGRVQWHRRWPVLRDGLLRWRRARPCRHYPDHSFVDGQDLELGRSEVAASLAEGSG